MRRPNDWGSRDGTAQALAGGFALDVCGYSAMSNHPHLVCASGQPHGSPLLFDGHHAAGVGAIALPVRVGKSGPPSLTFVVQPNSAVRKSAAAAHQGLAPAESADFPPAIWTTDCAEAKSH